MVSYNNCLIQGSSGTKSFNEGDQCGYSVSNEGNVNGDGFCTKWGKGKFHRSGI